MFSKNRHGRCRESGVFRDLFEEIVCQCMEAGLWLERLRLAEPLWRTKLRASKGY